MIFLTYLITGGRRFLMVLLGVGVAICVIVLSMVCTNYLCCYAIYSCCYIQNRAKEIQDINRKWYSMKCARPCNKTCATLAMASWTLLVVAVIVWSIMLNFVVPQFNFHIHTLVLGLNPFVIEFPAVAFPLVMCNFTCSVFRVNMLVSRSIKSLCPGFKKEHFRITPTLVDDSTRVQEFTNEDIEDEIKSQGTEMLKSEAQKHVVNKFDEKLGEKMGFKKKGK